MPARRPETPATTSSSLRSSSASTVAIFHGILNLFAPVRLAEAGGFRWQGQRSNSGDYVELRAEMDMLVGFSNCPHPLDPDPTYQPKPVVITRYEAAAPAADDLCRTATAEAVRGFENNALMQA